MSFSNPFDVYSDSRTHPHPGPSRNARLAKVTLPGGGLISKGEDGRIAVAGRESLRILRISDTSRKIESSRNLWDGSGLKIDCASTDVAWAYGAFNNKILTSARNGELIVWDLNRSGHSKYERKTKEHLRSIHALSVSRVAHHYCITGSADADFRIWDLRDTQSSVMRVHNPSAVRRVIFSPCTWNPLFVLVGMDNGTIHRWDLKMGQRGLLDRLPVAHMAPITSLDWYSGGEVTSHAISISSPQPSDDYTGNTLGWVASAGWDRCVKVWNLTGPEVASHMPNKPTYTLHTSYPIRRVLWRPGFECELAVVSHADFTVSSSHVDHLRSTPSSTALASGFQSRVSSGLGLDAVFKGLSELKPTPKECHPIPHNPSPVLDAVEIWDVRRSWIPKWSVTGTSAEGGVTAIEFADPHSLLAQNTNGTFTQVDLRDASKPLDAISRASTTWTPDDSFAFVTDNIFRWEIPYDDIHPDRLGQEISVPKSSLKQIGDPSFRPTTQKFGAFSSAEAHLNADAFRQLASSYIINGDDLPDLCMKNMQAALAAGKPHVAQMWMLMSTTLTERVPSLPPTPPQSPPPQRVTSLTRLSRQAITTPRQPLPAYKFPPSASASRSPDVPRSRGSPRQLPIAFERSSKFAHRSPSLSKQRSPLSSNSSSPLHHAVNLPPVTPRRTSFFSRRESLDSGGSARRSVLLRRQSVPTSAHSASPIDKNSAGVRNAGEGVLSDSDSSTEDTVESCGEEEDTVGALSTDEERGEEDTFSLPVPPTPSPLSTIVQEQYWTDPEEEDEASPSPKSSDTESGGDSNSARRKPYINKTRRLPSSRVKTRSRSSTLASLPAPSRLNSISARSQSRVTPSGANDRQPAQPLPEVGKDSEMAARDTSSRYRGKPKQDANDALLPAKTSKVITRREDIVVLHESRMLEYGWDVLRQAFEEFVVTGDVQTAATMAVIAPEQLKISLRRRLHIYDAYIDQLQKFQLYTTAAYFRKHSKVQQIRNMTLDDLNGRVRRTVTVSVVKPPPSSVQYVGFLSAPCFFNVQYAIMAVINHVIDNFT
ncbi:hypothetical protein AGABI1DRAFT_132849 [Agaricus bisporus var. burnettii JB137-S8]|uniref:Uncharacterized protein n=1 Tax=Agaricus bisporus var. burnettii (strain JB137-S8 / ATCC MYA-4627 / FGSC 10392) TaxID=597362 RepID=K5WW63_AGABU|nr:uncharacterized protein AGABI1DRAFT_132849 [Agaricus bisporus var. burnettii JB137-S8]EKM74807.1 hypothetical protein AGABI1DRAFT_132849 [Agaricus bisporus var. burnettii JB137-S8]